MASSQHHLELPIRVGRPACILVNLGAASLATTWALSDVHQLPFELIEWVLMVVWFLSAGFVLGRLRHQGFWPLSSWPERFIRVLAPLIGLADLYLAPSDQRYWGFIACILGVETFLEWCLWRRSQAPLRRL